MQVNGSHPLQQWLQANPKATMKEAITEAKKSGDDGANGLKGISTEEAEILENHFDADIIDNSEIEAFSEKTGRNYEFNEGEVLFHKNEIAKGENGTREVSRESGSVETEVPLDDTKSAGEGEIELDDRLEQLQDNPTDYIDPSDGYDYTTADGETENISLEDAILADFADVKDVFDDGADLKAGIDQAFPDNSLSDEDADFLFNMIENGNPTGPDGNPTQEDIKQLQITMAKIDGNFEELVAQNGADGGKDGLYGFATTEQIRNLSADIRPESTTEVENFDVVGVQTFFKSPEIPKGYDEVMIVMDRSASMNDDRDDVAAQVQQTINDKSQNTQFGLMTFGDNANDRGASGEMRANLGADPNQVVEQLGSVPSAGTAEESGINAALAAMEEADYSSPSDKPENKRLMRIYTDEQEQGASKREIEKLQELAQEKGIDVEFVFRRRDNYKVINLNDLTRDHVQSGGKISWGSRNVPGEWQN